MARLGWALATGFFLLGMAPGAQAGLIKLTATYQGALVGFDEPREDRPEHTLVLTAIFDESDVDVFHFDDGFASLIYNRGMDGLQSYSFVSPLLDSADVPLESAAFYFSIRSYDGGPLFGEIPLDSPSYEVALNMHHWSSLWTEQGRCVIGLETSSVPLLLLPPSVAGDECDAVFIGTVSQTLSLSKVAAIPEPGTMALMAAGLLGLCARPASRRRRRLSVRRTLAEPIRLLGKRRIDRSLAAESSVTAICWGGAR